MSTRSADVHRQKRWAKRAERRRDHVDKYKHPDRELTEKRPEHVNGEDADSE